MSQPADRVSPTGLPARRATVNQLIGYNIGHFRRAAGMTQEELGARLGGWSGASVSAAERSWEGRRVRQFSADEIAAIAAVLGVPVPALLLPPADAGTAVEYVFTAGPEQIPPMSGRDLLERVLPGYGDASSPAMMAFRERLMALGARAAGLGALIGEGQQDEMAALLQRQAALERRIDDLREFERLYRTKLLEYLQGQISDLYAGAADDD